MVADVRATPSVVLIGGPDSGKSNYIFRLWLAMNQGLGKISCDGLPNDLDYLLSGSQSLLKGEFAPHTPHDVFSENIIPFKFENGDVVTRGELILPDCFGERWTTVFYEAGMEPRLGAPIFESLWSDDVRSSIF